MAYKVYDEMSQFFLTFICENTYFLFINTKYKFYENFCICCFSDYHEQVFNYDEQPLKQ